MTIDPSLFTISEVEVVNHDGELLYSTYIAHPESSARLRLFGTPNVPNRTADPIVRQSANAVFTNLKVYLGFKNLQSGPWKYRLCARILRAFEEADSSDVLPRARERIALQHRIAELEAHKASLTRCVFNVLSCGMSLEEINDVILDCYVRSVIES